VRRVASVAYREAHAAAYYATLRDCEMIVAHVAHARRLSPISPAAACRRLPLLVVARRAFLEACQMCVGFVGFVPDARRLRWPCARS
jgi:hypothetical protein